tara:strand:- start:155153 stop:155650 length:498 start_codon:yes stop_codon:yes gene_type:complete
MRIDFKFEFAKLMVGMTRSRFTFWMTWVLIAAQACVLAVGYGRVVMCYDDNGTSHIEIVDEKSCSPRVDEGCTQPVSTQTDVQTLTDCSEFACVDEPFGLLATLPVVRTTDNGKQLDVQPNPSLVIVSWLLKQNPIDAQVSSASLNDQYAMDAFHRSNRSTVLVL